MNKYYTPFKNFCVENFPYIEADFDAITNYELLCLVVEYLNRVIDSQNYLINWFNDLDVTDEIEKKLDEMIASGEFEEILKQILISNGPITSIYNSNIYHKPNNLNDFNVDLLSMSSSEYLALWDELATRYPDKIKSYVHSYDAWNNPLKYYVLEQNSTKDCGINSAGEYYVENLENNLHTVPYMFITSGVHGNEKSSAYNLYLAFKNFLERKKRSDDYILNNYSFVILPCVNPSGFDDNTRNNRNNVNINRNLPTTTWANQEDSDKGSSPNSENETRFIVSMLDAYSEQKYKVGMVVTDFHSHHYYLHEDKRVLWYSANRYQYKQHLLKLSEALKSLILGEFPELAVDRNNPNEHFIHFTSGGTQANVQYYAHQQGFCASTTEVPDSFVEGVPYSDRSMRIGYMIVANSILSELGFSGKEPLVKYMQLAQIGCTTNNSLLEVIEALPNASELMVVVSSDSRLKQDMPVYKGENQKGLLHIRKSRVYESDVTELTFSSYALKIPKRWIASYNNLDHFFGWSDIGQRVYGNVGEISRLEENGITNPTLAQVIDAMDNGSIAILRIGSSDNSLYSDCMNKLGIVTIKKPRYTYVDAEIEFIGTGSDFDKFYNIYYRGEFRGWKKVNLTSV